MREEERSKIRFDKGRKGALYVKTELQTNDDDDDDDLNDGGLMI